MAESIRQRKVASQIQRIVATVLLRDIADPRVDGLISVTRVEVTPDLREARVHLSVMAAQKPAPTVIEGIRSAGRHIQGAVAKGLPLRFVPRLTFLLDESLKKEAQILKKIDEAVGRDSGAAEVPPPTLPPSASADADEMLDQGNRPI